MYERDVEFLVAPRSHEPLQLGPVIRRADDGEILEGSLFGRSLALSFPIVNGIPRFAKPSAESSSWDFKWTALDAGQGANYRIIDRSDPAYEMHDLFDRNSHGGKAYDHVRGRVALDLGCGVGQYTIRLLKDCGAERVVALDLTRGVDVFRRILDDRYPELRPSILLVQADVFEMPFLDDTFDYVMSLGVLMHTGNTRGAIRQACRVLKVGGQANLWVYASASVPYEATEPNRDINYRSPVRFAPTMVLYTIQWLWIHLLRRLSNKATLSIIRAFSSETWLRLTQIPVVGLLASLIFPTVRHPDPDYRLINNYDGWCNAWSDSWSVEEIFPVLRDSNLALLGVSQWPLGFWGKKDPEFYR